MSVERLGEENDVEKKIFIDTGLEALNSLRQGQLQDGDGNRNSSINETPCAELPGSVCEKANKEFVDVCMEGLSMSTLVLTADRRNERDV